MKRFFPASSLTLMGAAVLASSVGFSVEAHAQDRGSSDLQRPWELVASLGMPLGGPAEALEEAMRVSGFADTTGGTEHPFTSGPDPSWAISLRRRLRPRLDIELMANSATTGTTFGLDGPGAHFLFLDHSVTTFAPIVAYRRGPFRVGAGPTANHVRLERTDSGGGGSREEWKVGVLADAGIAFPRRSRFFFEGRGQYRWIPGTEAGPFTSGSGFPDDIPSTMPAVDVGMSHALLLVGVGARF